MITFKENISTKEKADFFNNLLYPVQFENKNKNKLHIIKLCMGLGYSEKIILGLFKKHVSPDSTEIDVNIAIGYYKSNFESIADYNCFTYLEKVLGDDAYIYHTVGSSRKIKLVEYKFVLKKLVVSISKDKLKNRKITYKYFTMTKGVYTDYKKVTGRSCQKNRHKIAHIFNTLESYGLIHRIHHSDNSVSYQVGPDNPYYKLKMFPNILEGELNTMKTKTTTEISDHKNALISVISDNKELQKEIDKLKIEVENLRDVEFQNKLLKNNNDQLEGFVDKLVGRDDTSLRKPKFDYKGLKFDDAG